MENPGSKGKTDHSGSEDLSSSSLTSRNLKKSKLFHQNDDSPSNTSYDQQNLTAGDAHENASDNCSTPDKFLNLFGTDMEEIDKMSGAIEIGDEVTVPSSPLTFQNYSDHSYFSSPNLITPPSSIRFGDCQDHDTDSISISDPGLQLPLPEFHIHDLFDLGTEYQAFDQFFRNHDNNIDLQEQIIESGHSTRDSESFLKSNLSQIRSYQSQFSWMFPCDIPTGTGTGTEPYDYDNENENTNEENSDCSSSSEEEATCMEAETDHQDFPSNPFEVRDESARGTHSKNKRSNSSYHHSGPFPHTFISVPGDRRSRFCFGLQTIVTKIRALMSRTGATATFRAEFESHAFTLDNVDKLIKFSKRSQKLKSSKGKSKVGKIMNPPSPCDKSNESEGAGAGADDDHRYAATILTQSESSPTVTDHQYNEVSTTNCVGDKRSSTSVEKSYIRTRYARERWLRKAATTIYSKMQRLINRTGAKMTLLIEYDGLLVIPKNYKELEHLLGTYRPSMKKFNTKITIQNHSHGHGQRRGGSCTSLSSEIRGNGSGNENPSEGKGREEVNNVSASSSSQVQVVGTGTGCEVDTSAKQCDEETLMKMKVSFPRSRKSINQSLRIEFLDTGRSSSCVSPAPSSSRGSNLGLGLGCTGSAVGRPTPIESDHDYDSQHGVTHDQNFYSDSDFSNQPGVVGPSTSTQGISAPCGASFVPQAVISSRLFGHSNLGVSIDAGNSVTPALPPVPVPVKPTQFTKNTSVDAYTITDPRCELCGKSSQVLTMGSTAIAPIDQSKFPLWIRCANPLCQYLVHPSCIGFFVINSQQLQLLPPFFCPGHRNDP